MSDFTTGLAITLIGMGGTILSLWLLTLTINFLKKVFPYDKSEEQRKDKV